MSDVKTLPNVFLYSDKSKYREHADKLLLLRKTSASIKLSVVVRLWQFGPVHWCKVMHNPIHVFSIKSGIHWNQFCMVKIMTIKKHVTKSQQTVIYRSVVRLFSWPCLSVRRADYSNLAPLLLVPGLLLEQWDRSGDLDMAPTLHLNLF